MKQETIQALKGKIDPKLIKQREGWKDRQGNVKMVDYIEWHTACEILDDNCPDWTHTVKDIKQIGEIVIVTVAITVEGVTREGVGTGTSESELGIKKAEHDALKRAAVKFGVGRELYKKESEIYETQGSHSSNGGVPANPIAKSLSDLVTAKQLGMIRAIAREIGVDADEECQSLMQCKTDEMSKKAASAMIQHLQDMQKNGEATGQPPPRREREPTNEQPHSNDNGEDFAEPQGFWERS